MAKKDLELISETHQGKVLRVSQPKEKFIHTIQLDDEKYIKAFLDEKLKEGEDYMFLFLTDPESEWTDVEVLSHLPA
jgi:hypothetical protein